MKALSPKLIACAYAALVLSVPSLAVAFDSHAEPSIEIHLDVLSALRPKAPPVSIEDLFVRVRDANIARENAHPS